MAAADDDSTLTHLCTAWVDLAQVCPVSAVTALMRCSLLTCVCLSGRRQAGRGQGHLPGALREVHVHGEQPAAPLAAPVTYRCQPQCDEVQARLLNGMAVCHMRLGDWSDAESYLLEAYEKDAKNADTLANLVTVSLHLGKSTARHSRYASPGFVVLAPHLTVSYIQC